MNAQLDSKRKASGQPTEEESAAREKASAYALLNRPSPPF